MQIMYQPIIKKLAKYAGVMVLSFAMYLVFCYIAQNRCNQVTPVFGAPGKPYEYTVFNLKWCTVFWPVFAIMQAVLFSYAVSRLRYIWVIIAYIVGIWWLFTLPSLGYSLGIDHTGGFGYTSYDGVPNLKNTPYLSVVSVPWAYTLAYAIIIFFKRIAWGKEIHTPL
jgi:hypothetical protein